MELNNEFRVGVSVPETWKVLTDVERIAPMLPGAQLQEVEGDEYRGVVKVKVGPITAQYKGTATFVERDESAGRVVIKASGRDTRGQGNASATITATMTPDGDGTKVGVVTDLTVTGKVAQFGRGVLADVSSKLIGQFVSTLEKDLESSGPGANGAPTEAAPEAGEEVAPTTAEGLSQAASDPLTSSAPTTAGTADTATPVETGTPVETETPAAMGAPAEATGPRRIEGPDAEPVDLLAVAGGSTFKRLVPLVVVVLVIAVVLRRGRRR